MRIARFFSSASVQSLRPRRWLAASLRGGGGERGKRGKRKGRRRRRRGGGGEDGEEDEEGRRGRGGRRRSSSQFPHLVPVFSFQGSRQRQIIYRVTSQQDSSVLQVISGPETSVQEEMPAEAVHVFIDGHGESSEPSVTRRRG